MDENRLRGLTGLCVRAGQGIFGEDSCLKAVRNAQAELLIMDESISPGSAEKLIRACGRDGIPVRTLPAGMLAEATGRPGKVMAVRSGSFAGPMIQCLDKTGGDITKQ